MPLVIRLQLLPPSVLRRTPSTSTPAQTTFGSDGSTARAVIRGTPTLGHSSTISTGSFWSKLAQLNIDGHFLPGVLVGARFSLSRPCLGSTIALHRNSLVAIGGLSGSGKTTVARGLAPDLGPAPGAIVLRSDVIRKAMFDVPETEKLSQDAYVPAVTAEVYTRLRARALQISQFGYGVIADATFSNDVERHLLEDAARAANVSFTGLWLDASPATLERRIVCRKSDASDADISVLARQIAATSPPTDWKKVDANGLPTEVVGRARDLAGAVR